MSFREASPGEIANGRYWANIAIDSAMKIGLHFIGARQGRLNNEDKLLKRIWWSCLIRDRLISLNSKSCVYITDEAHNIPCLDLEDFNIQSSDPTAIDCEESIWHEEVQKHLSIFSIAIAELSQCIGLVTYIRFSRRFSSQLRTAKHEILGIQSERRERQEADITRECNERLSEWLETNEHYFTAQTHTALQAHIATSQALLHSIYYETVQILHQGYQ